MLKEGGLQRPVVLHTVYRSAVRSLTPVSVENADRVGSTSVFRIQTKLSQFIFFLKLPQIRFFPQNISIIMSRCGHIMDAGKKKGRGTSVNYK
jgi:hypothetical protein